MPKKEKKKSWKERRRERQIKQQRVQEAYRIQRESEIKRKPRKWPKGKILAAVCLLVLIFGAFGAWQYIKPSGETSDGTETPPPGISPGQIIYIRADGRVDPSAAPIVNVGNSRYTLTVDISNPIIVERDNIVIDGANHVLQGSGDVGSSGIDLTGISNVTVTNMIIQGFDFGVYLSSASHNVLSQNDLSNNYCGIWLEVYSGNNLISGNNIANNEMYAIWLKDSPDNNISENEITSHGNYTIYIGSSNHVTVSANYIANNNVGLFIYQSSNNIVYHNDFVDNRVQASVLNVTSVWDNGYPSGGNYWSDYNEKYPSATELEGSGIWNTPYVIDENNQDNYPLMTPLNS
jgi:parallel beta-helix repeat protein